MFNEPDKDLAPLFVYDDTFGLGFRARPLNFVDGLRTDDANCDLGFDHRFDGALKGESCQ